MKECCPYSNEIERTCGGRFAAILPLVFLAGRGKIQPVGLTTRAQRAVSELVRRPLIAFTTWRTTTLVSFYSGPESLPGASSFCLRNCVVGMRLYVGNLSYNVTSQSLETLFTEFGQV